MGEGGQKTKILMLFFLQATVDLKKKKKKEGFKRFGNGVGSPGVVSLTCKPSLVFCPGKASKLQVLVLSHVSYSPKAPSIL